MTTPDRECLLNLSAWIERRKDAVGPYADHIIHSVKAYETEIESLRTRPAPTVQEAAKVLLDACPNPIFDRLKYPMIGEYSVEVGAEDADGAIRYWHEDIEWTTIKQIITDALRTLAGKETHND